jgi:cell wall-associated NlpC family hydrolase
MKKQLMIMATSAGILFGSYSMQGLAAENTYTVKSGDSLWKIASLNNTTVQNLMSYNNLTSSTINIGQQLNLSIPTEQNTTYTVKSGDCLSLIANAYNTTVIELKSINNLTSDVIFIGQTLKISSGRADLSAPTPITNPSTYTVMSGDTLTKIALNYQITVSELKSINNLVSDAIYVGQVLNVNSASVTPENKVSNFNADALITEAKKYIGVPYVWGGSTPAGFDCSGFINYVFNRQGFNVPRTVATLWAAGTTDSTPQLGDIVFFGPQGSVPTHAGIYIGNNQFIHAGSSTGITISNLTSTYWQSLYTGVKSIVK